ncbi:DNA-binding transcriptional regulator, FrmR family [Dethiosulfatibacter aminovorans DSM 17477]|uniref:Copper-sensing transcriptional repressor CsoR n=1 Tax=Dethiosulfatibacter aminovorans DSM 17477 TaxID=1121476 RepID=A0A1M6AC37_9FIRM|nr:metal-sensing transcriptional repressor [Dethiosulfatibacter aminovorans]SHI34062.1 DNA-binding transcriptional regulator, FrmR family [Dethiosulfatibacter aminovorans DSM 17477]
MKADKKRIMRYLKTSKGQIEGIMRMVDEDRYCVDISTQVLAVQAILKKANHEILKAHIDGCIKTAFKNEDKEEEKIDEVMKILDKYYNI